MNTTSQIYSSTLRQCIAWQQSSAALYAAVREEMGANNHVPSMRSAQSIAAFEANQARVRLDMLNGNA